MQQNTIILLNGSSSRNNTAENCKKNWNQTELILITALKSPDSW